MSKKTIYFNDEALVEAISNKAKQDGLSFGAMVEKLLSQIMWEGNSPVGYKTILRTELEMLYRRIEELLTDVSAEQKDETERGSAASYGVLLALLYDQRNYDDVVKQYVAAGHYLQNGFEPYEALKRGKRAVEDPELDF